MSENAKALALNDSRTNYINSKHDILPNETIESDHELPGNDEEHTDEALGQHDDNCTTYHSLAASFRADNDENIHLNQVCESFRQYGGFALLQWESNRYRLSSLPASQKQFLPPALQCDSDSFLQRKEAYHQAAIRNQFFLDCILQHAGQPHSQQERKTQEDKNQKAKTYATSTESHLSKVSSVLKSLTRDWSNEGKAERQMTYIPIIESVRKYLPVFQSASKDDPILSGLERSRICVPGAGVGRLMCELSSLGYTVQGNEFSLHMLLASDFILNGPVKSDRPFKISPWLLETRNLHSFDDQIRVVSIPDQDPYELVMTSVRDSTNPVDSLSPPDFSMVAGDFVSVYSSVQHQNSWDCIVACFFLDASPSIVEYLQVCYNMLRVGGLLISFGPLLWHWSGPPMTETSIHEYMDNNRRLDSRYLDSFDFCWNDIHDILINIGFEIMECTSGMKALYTADCRSMMHTESQCVHFVARKKFIETETE